METKDISENLIEDLKREKEITEFYSLAEKYGFIEAD